MTGSLQRVLGGRPIAVNLPRVGADPLAAAARVDAGDALDNDVAREAANIARDRAEASRSAETERLRVEDGERRKLGEYHQREADSLNAVERARGHDGRKVFTAHDAQVRAQIATLLHAVVGGKPAPLDPIFGAAVESRAVSAAVDHAIRADAAGAEPAEAVGGEDDAISVERAGLSHGNPTFTP